MPSSSSTPRRSRSSTSMNVGPVSLGHAHHGQQGQLLSLMDVRGRAVSTVEAGCERRHGSRFALRLHFCAARVARPSAQGIRDRIRARPRQATAVNESQAADAHADAHARSQSVRSRSGCARPAPSTRPGKVLDGRSSRPKARARQGRASASARFRRVEVVDVPGARHARRPRGPTASQSRSRWSLAGRQDSPRYVMEIVDRARRFLSVPNEAIIEEGDKRVVYVQQQAGQYVPQEIHDRHPGRALHRRCSSGLKEGDRSSPSAASSSTPSTS